MIVDSGEPTPEQAKHLENCEAGAQLVLKSTAVAPSHLERILSDIRDPLATKAQTIFPEKASSAAAGFAETTPDTSLMALASPSTRENTLQAPRETRGRRLLKLVPADDQTIFRAGIAKELAVEDDLHIVAQAQTPAQR